MRKLKKKLNRVMALIISILIIFSVTSCTGDSIFTGASKSITSYSIPNATVIIDEAAKTITATVPYATDLTALIATFTTTGSNVKVADALQASAISANDFTTPLVYTVEAADGSTQTYTVMLTIAQNSAKAITAFSFVGFPNNAGVINETAKTIAVSLPNATDATALVANYTTTGSSVWVTGALQTTGVSTHDFSSSLIYTVEAADGSTQEYAITVTIALSSTKAITAFSFANLSNSIGDINDTAKTIQVSILPGTDLTALIATFTTTGSNVKVADALQASAISANDFTTPLVYTVEAADGSTQTYTVTVTQGSGPNPIVLGTAGNFVLLTEAGITTTGATVIIGDIGVSPIASASITGFALIMDTTGTFSTSTMVTGKIYAADYAMPTPTYTATAVSDMIAAYSDGLGRAAGVGITNFNLGGGTLNNDNLSPGTYTWASALTIPTDIMLTGGVNDVWIFQVAGTLNLAANKKIILVGGAQAKNIYWQVSGAVTLGADSVFNGAILTETSASLGTGATVNGSLLAQTAATLISNTITKE